MAKKKYKIPVKVPFIFRVIHSLFPTLEKVAPFLANRITAMVFFSPMRFKAPDKEVEAGEIAEKTTLTSSGKRVQIYRWGNGPTVLMTHGWSGRGTQFRKFIKPFNEAGYSVVSFDGPAHGKSKGRKTNVTEFHDIIRQLENKYGPFKATIGHSFGGVANLFATVQGVPISRMIMIATPTIADDIINESIKKLNGSRERGEFLKNFIFQKFGVHFEEVSVLNLIEQIEDVEILIIHDENDREVSMRHPEALIAKFPSANLIKTKGLGHIRILKSSDVVKYSLEFIEQAED